MFEGRINDVVPCGCERSGSVLCGCQVAMAASQCEDENSDNGEELFAMSGLRYDLLNPARRSPKAERGGLVAYADSSIAFEFGHPDRCSQVARLCPSALQNRGRIKQNQAFVRAAGALGTPTQSDTERVAVAITRS